MTDGYKDVCSAIVEVRVARDGRDETTLAEIMGRLEHVIKEAVMGCPVRSVQIVYEHGDMSDFEDVPEYGPHVKDKQYAMTRLDHMRRRLSEMMDEEERHHIDEALRIIKDEVPDSFFAGFGDFQGPSK